MSSEFPATSPRRRFFDSLLNLHQTELVFTLNKDSEDTIQLSYYLNSKSDIQPQTNSNYNYYGFFQLFSDFFLPIISNPPLLNDGFFQQIPSHVNKCNQEELINDDSTSTLKSTPESTPKQERDTPVSKDEPLWLKQATGALEKGDMELCQTGVGGTYFVLHGNKKIAIFKPIDQEPGAINNPKNKMVVPLLPPGKGGLREAAAYKLDKNNFTGIPETFFVEVTTPQGVVNGSLQKYLENVGDCNDYGANKFSIDNVHRIGIFDIRSLNMDRNDENLIIVKNAKEESLSLIPIDHAFCFPEKIDPYFNWQFWSQAKKPFSQETLDFISSINVLEDAQMLIDMGLDEKSVENTIASTLLLIKMASEGKTLFDISLAVTGKNSKLLQILEVLQQNQTKIEEESCANINNPTTQIEKLLLFKNRVESVLNTDL